MSSFVTAPDSLQPRSPPVRIRRLIGTVPTLTGRGITVLLALIALGFGPAIQETDIVAAVLVASGGVVFILGWLWCAIATLSVKEQLTPKLLVSNSQASADERLSSDRESLLLLRLGTVAVPPLTRLRSQVSVAGASRSGTPHLLAGVLTERTLRERYRFPHRGRWENFSLRCQVVDAFGLSQVRWTVPLSTLAEVYPPQHASDQIPILSSCQRSGDDIVDIHQKQGEPYDLKPYNPTDGSRKIVWKLYAKRGELISRQPEPSLTPEGRTVIFICGRAQDDAACGLALDYVRRLRELRLDVAFGAEGSAPCCSPERSQEVRDVEAVLLENVWAAESSPLSKLGDDLARFVDHVQETYRDSRVEQMLVFLAPERFQSSEMTQSVVRALTKIEAKGIRPILCHTAPRSTTPPPRHSSALDVARRWFWNHAGTDSEKLGQPFWSEFLREVSAKRWERYSER